MNSTIERSIKTSNITIWENMNTCDKTKLPIDQAIK